MRYRVARSPSAATDALSDHHMGHSIAPHEHHADKPATAQTAADRNLVQCRIIGVETFSGAQPALL
jgi:hypothetical protein